jgi:hypothetical protein
MQRRDERIVFSGEDGSKLVGDRVRTYRMGAILGGNVAAVVVDEFLADMADRRPCVGEADGCDAVGHVGVGWLILSRGSSA